MTERVTREEAETLRQRVAYLDTAMPIGTRAATLRLCDAYLAMLTARAQPRPAPTREPEDDGDGGFYHRKRGG